MSEEVSGDIYDKDGMGPMRLRRFTLPEIGVTALVVLLVAVATILGSFLVCTMSKADSLQDDKSILMAEKAVLTEYRGMGKGFKAGEFCTELTENIESLPDFGIESGLRENIKRLIALTIQAEQLPRDAKTYLAPLRVSVVLLDAEGQVVDQSGRPIYQPIQPKEKGK